MQGFDLNEGLGWVWAKPLGSWSWEGSLAMSGPGQRIVSGLKENPFSLPVGLSSKLWE